MAAEADPDDKHDMYSTECSESRCSCTIAGMRILSTIDVMARFGKALADPTRAAVLQELKDGPAFPADLAETIGVSRQILSNHLACLRDCGLVAAEPVGRRIRYELANARLGHALNDLLDTILSVDPAGDCVDPGSAPSTEARSAASHDPLEVRHERS